MATTSTHGYVVTYDAARRYADRQRSLLDGTPGEITCEARETRGGWEVVNYVLRNGIKMHEGTSYIPSGWYERDLKHYP